jgi:hypothetical protein
MPKHRAITEEEPGRLLAAMADLNAQAADVSARLHADVAALALLHRQMAELVVRLCTTSQRQDAAINSCADAANSRCYATCWSRPIYRLAHGSREDVSRSAPTRPEGRRVDRGRYRELDAQPTVVVIPPLALGAASLVRIQSPRPLSEFRGDTGVTAPTLSSATSLIPTTALRVPRHMRWLSLTPHVPRPQPRHHGRMRHASAFVELGDACVNFVDAPALGVAVASDRFSRVQFRTASLHRYTSFRSPIFTTTTISWSSRIW